MSREPVNVLVSLHRGYGLGDAVSMSVVLQHIRAARPHWRIDYRAEEGRHQVGRGIADRTFSYDDIPYPDTHYDADVQLKLYDKWYGWVHRPNTSASMCLHECLQLEWDVRYADYVVNVSDSVRNWAVDTVPPNSVAIHTKGVTAKVLKDLTDDETKELCDYVSLLGYRPYMIEKLPKGYDAEVVCAAIGQCRAFVGIDSGPSKCAAATDVPSLVVWTGHHPVQHFDPSPLRSVTHLIPFGCHDGPPIGGDDDVIRFYEANYRSRVYVNCDPIPEIKRWLQETLK